MTPLYVLKNHQMKSSLKYLLLSTTIILMTSCYSTSVIGNGSDPESGRNGLATQEITFHSWLWGISSKNLTDGQCQGGTFQKVEIKDNLLYSLVNVITLGIYKPTKVCYTCAKQVEN